MRDQEGNEVRRVELDRETAELVASLHGRVEQLDMFTLLDVDLNVSLADLRRAYFRRSMVFHPDRYFTRELGDHKAMLEKVFGFISAAYNFLKDDRRRAAYRQKILDDRDKPGAWTTSGGRVSAIRTPFGLKFIVKDEESFFGPPANDGRQTPKEPDPTARPVGLPQKRYALPRLRPSTPAAGGQDDDSSA